MRRCSWRHILPEPPPVEGRASGVIPLSPREPLTVARVVAKLDRGGAQLSLLRVASALARRGIRTRLLAGWATADGIELAREHGLEPEVYGDGGNLQWVPDPAFAEWLVPRLRDADAVHAHMFGGWWAAAGAVPDGTPLIASEHNAYRWPERSYGRAIREALPRVDRFYAHGPGATHTVLTSGLPADRLQPGISPVTGMDAVRLPGMPAGAVVFSGRLDPDKGPDLFLDAIALMEARAQVFMLGAGRLESELRAQRARLQLRRRVRMTGWLRDPAPTIAGAAVLVIPSRDESFSQTAVLGMSLGVPVIGTDVDGFPETLGDGRGIIVPPEDPAALAAAIDGVLAGRLRVDTDAARRFAQRFAPERVAGIYEEAYRTLAGTPYDTMPVPA